MAVYTGIFAKKFTIEIKRADQEGIIAELQETGICSTDEGTFDQLQFGKGDPNQVFQVNAGLIGTFEFAKKSSLLISPVGVIEGVLRARYTIKWSIYAIDFSNIFGGAT